MKKIIKFFCYFCLLGTIVMFISKEYDSCIFYFVCFLILLVLLNRKKIIQKYKYDNNLIEPFESKESTKKESDNVTFCPKCGLVLENTIICPECNKFATVENQTSNINFRQFMKDYATEIVLWGYDKPRKIITDDNKTPVYYKSECNIFNIRHFMNEIIEQGLLRHANNNELLETLKISELKDILKNNELSQTGNKDILIKKIIENNLIVPIFSQKDDYYVLSDYGRIFYEDNIEYLELHKHQKYQITPKEYYNIRKELSKEKGYSYRDCIWRIFQQRILEYSKSRQYSQLYYNYLNMLDLTYKEEKYNVAINLCIKCIIFELCGVYYYGTYESYYKYKDDFFKKTLLDSIKSSNYINENNLVILSNIKEYYNSEILQKEYSSLEMKFKLCSLEVISKIIEELINNSQFDINEYLPIIKKEQINNIKKYL